MNGILFGDKHSYRDWGLILASRPVISPPSAKTIYIDVPGSNGSIDLTEALTGDVAYDDRPVTFVFSVIEKRNKWSDIYSEIMDYLHGRKMKILIDEDSDYYYIGRLSVNDWASDKASATITIEGTVEPFKVETHSSLEDWLWDDFDFETGIIREYKDIRVDGEKKFIIEGRRKPIVPTFITIPDKGSVLKVVWKGIEYTLPSGTSKVINIITSEGINELTFLGNGTISIDYRGGRL